MSGTDSQWSLVVRPLLNVPYNEYNHKQLTSVLKFLELRKEEFLNIENDKHETFFSSYVALTVNYLINHVQKIPITVELEPTVKLLLQYLLDKCKSKDAQKRSNLTTSQLLGLIHSLCTARTSNTSDMTTFAASLRAAVNPDYVTSPVAEPSLPESTVDDDPEADDLTPVADDSKPTDEMIADSSADFLTSLQTYTMMSEYNTESEERDKRQQLAEISTRIFTQTLNGRATLIEFMSCLEFIQRYTDGLDTLISNGDMLSPVNNSSVSEFKSSIPALINHMSAVCKAVSIPAMYITNNETEMKKIVRIVMSCLFAGSYAVLCAALSDTSDTDSAVSPVTKKAIDILNAMAKGVRLSPRLPKHMHTNTQAMCAWLIFSTLDTLCNQANNKPDLETSEAKPASSAAASSSKFDSAKSSSGASRWGLAAHSYALEGLSCLISVAKEALPGQVPNKSSSRTSARLQEAHKYNLSQMNVAQEYTYLDLLKFVCSGSTLRLSGILFSVTSALMQKYTSLLEARKVQDKLESTPENEKDNDFVAPQQESEPTPPPPRSSQTTPAPLLTMVSIADDDSVDSLTGVFNQLFVEDLLYDEMDMPGAPPEYQSKSMIDRLYDTSMINAWVEAATSYILFFDKYIVPSAVLRDYLCSELSHTRSQQSLSLLAVLVKSTAETSSDNYYHKFCMAIRRLCRHLFQKQILDKPAQENMLLMVDLFPDNLIGWPVSAHRNLLAILTEVVLSWQNLPNWDKHQDVVVEMWRHFLDSVLSECVTANHNSKEIEDVNVEHCQAMLALLYTLSDDNKKQVFTYLCKTLMSALDTATSQLVTMIPLPITRLCLILEYMISHLTNAPSDLLQQVKDNILGEDSKPLNFLHEDELELTYRKNKKKKSSSSEDNEDDITRQPVFYKLCSVTGTGSDNQRPIVDPLAMKCLMSSEDEELDLADFYKHCLTAMLVGSSLDKAKKKEEMTVLDSCAVHYHIKVVWRLLGLLPPPPAFLLQMTDVATLGTQVAALQAVRLAPRLHNTDYVSWYKKTLKGTLEDSEIDGLLESVIRKTKSPSFEVQITLHIVQAQMATMMFASEGDVVEEKHLPGFHTIVTLDAVLSLTHALMDMHYQNLKDSVSAAEGASDYEEAKQLEFRRAAEDLLPALLLMLGSFTEFVRSCMLHQVTDDNKSRSSFAQLLTMTSAPDEMFNIFIVQPKELSSVVKKWKSDTFWQYPSLGGWRNFANVDSPSEGFANAVIQAHCTTLSDSCDGEWSTVLPLRHLHMTLVTLTTDISRWFPAMNSSEELSRTLMPLLFDGSISPNSSADATSCLNQVIGQVKVKEEKYVYMMKRWHSIMLSLHELSSSLSVDTNTQIVQVFSFFIQSCLEDNQIGQLLTQFYQTKAEFSDLLLVTGMPGCADIMSINRVLKIFTKLISLADSNSDNPHCHLLKSLNKLSQINQSVLCEWLQRIIMATPAQTDAATPPADIEGQVDKNAFLLHTIAAYMVKENSLIEASVPKAILQSLIVVATGVLHQTHNAQGFQELMLIMSTLAKSGEVLSLFSAIIKWLDSCIPYMTNREDTAKHSLYVELASCLLSYINDVLATLQAKGGDGTDDANHLWVDDLATACNFLSADEDEEVETTDWSAAAADETAANDKLDSQLCTFTETQRDFRQQHWYHCYTCKMTDGVGVCSICVKVCHKDHDVSYAKHGSFFCDCGEKGETFCQSLKKRNSNKKARSSSQPSSAGASTSAQRKSTQSRMMKAAASLRQRVSLSSLLTYSKNDILSVIEKEGLRETITKLLKTLEAEYLTRYREAMPQEAAKRVRKLLNDLSTQDKTCDSSDNLMLPQLLSVEGTLDNVKPSFNGDQGTTIKQLINSHMIRRHIICKVMSSGAKGQLLAVANDKGKITILSSLFKNMEHKKRIATMKTHSHTVPFTILSMSANPIDEDLIAVSGLKECHVLSLSSTGSVAKTTVLQPALETGNFIVKTHWLPGDNSSLAIVTADFIKIYNLSVDVISPKYYYLLPAGKVRDVTFCLDSETGITTILVMSSSGHVYTQVLNDESQALHGSFYITNALEINHEDISSQQAGRVVLGGGASIYYSHALSLLMISYTQGATFASSLTPRSTLVTKTNKVTFTKGKGNSSTQPMVQWSEVYGHPGLIFCITQSTNNPLALYVTPDQITIQELKATPPAAASNGSSKTNGSSNSKSTKVLDYEVVRSLNSSNKASTHVLLICEDGGLKILTANDANVGMWIESSLNPSSPFASHKPPKKAVQSKAAPVVSVQIPVDFFEGCTQTNDIEYGGNDILEIYNKNLVKQRLATTNQYIASTKTDSFKIEISNTSASHVLVGVRVMVGCRLLSRLPSYVEVFSRRKAVVTEGPRWIDFPFTREEAIKGINKIVLTVGASTHSEHVTFVDSIKVYSKSKDAFSWSDEEAANIGAQAQSQQTPPTLSAVTSRSTVTQAQETSKEAEEISASDADDVYSPQPTTPIDRLLADCLLILSRYLSAQPTTAQTASHNKPIEDSACKLVELLPPRCVEQSVHQLLQSLHVNDSSVVNKRMDEIRVLSIDTWMSLSLDELNPCTYQLILEWIRQLGHARPHNLTILANCAIEREGNEKRLLTDLVERFNHLYTKRPYNPMFSPACSPGLQNVKATVFALVDVVFIFASEKPDLMPFIISLCLQLLFSMDGAVRFACKQAMIRILRPKHKTAISKPSRTQTGETTSAAVSDSRPVRETGGQADIQEPAAAPQPVPPPAPVMPIAPPVAVDLQDWLEQEPPMIEPAMIDDLELAIALSLQEQDEDDDDEDDDNEDDDEDDDDEFHMVGGDDEPNIQDHMMAAAEQYADEMAAQQEAAQPTPANADIDSDGGQLSAHSSTEGVQNIGLTEPQRSESTSTLLPPAAGDGEGDTQQKKVLRDLVRQDMITQGLILLEKCNGVTAIPYLQVLLVLLSDLDTQEVQQSLESHLTTIIDRLVNFKQTTEAFMQRTDRAEVELIVLRLFSVLMSRSHNQENTNQSASTGATSSSGSKMNICAASVLIKASSLDFFLPLLKQLLNFWKSYNPDSEGSALMRVTHTNSAAKYDMSPFFLRQYVKEHPLDVFEVFPQLQTEMVLRLINQMKKISDSSADIMTLTFSDEWTRILSEYMGVCEPAFIRRQVRKLLNYICGSKDNYRRVRDTNTIALRMSTIREAAVQCGLSDNVNTVSGMATTAIPYITLTSMVENVKVILEIATSRCVNWQQYCHATPGTLELLLVLCVQTNQALADNLISLLHSAIRSPTSSSKPSSSAGLLTDEDLTLHKELITQMLTRVSPDLLSEFLRVYLLHTNQTPLRSQTHTLVLTMYEQATDREKNNLLKLLWPLWPQLSQYGKKAGMFVDLVGHMIIQTDLSTQKKQQFVSGVVDLLSHCNQQLLQHQNTNIYNMLQELVDLDGYYLEREPCMTCNDPEIPYSNLKLNNIKVDNKFTTTTHMIKLIGSHMISKIHLRITDIKKSKMVKTMTLYYSNRTVQSAVELKNRVGIWHQAKRVSLSSSQNDVKIDFTVPITACNLMIEYSEFYENNQATQETLPCPRCSASVPAVPGICVNCGENVFQCHKCRSINYDEKDPFLCNTCGFCKYAKFEMTLTARSCSAVDPIETEEDRTKTLSSVNTMLEKADKTYSEIQTTRSTLESLILQLSGAKSESAFSGSNTTSASTTGHVNKFIQQVATKYCDESKKHFDELSKSMQKVLMSRRELLEFDRKQSYEATTPMTPSVDSVTSQSYITDQLRMEAEINEQKITKKLNMTQQSSSSCYGCLTATVSHCITLLHALSTQSFSKIGEERLIRELVSSNLNSGPLNLRRDAMLLLCTLTKGNLPATTLLHDMLYQRITEAMDFCTTATSLAVNTRSEMTMIALSVDSDSSHWEERMKTVIRIYSRALQTNKSHVIEAVALTCLQIIKGQIITARPSTLKHRDKSLQEISGVTVDQGRPMFNIQHWLAGKAGYSYEEWKKLAKVGGAAAPSLAASVPEEDERRDLQKRYFDLWKRNIKFKSSLMSELNENSWLSHVLFNPSSQSSREMSAEIISQIAEVPERRLLLVVFLTKLLHKVPSAGTNASHFITLYKKLIEPTEVKYYLLVKHNILPYIAQIVSHEIEELCDLEETTLGSDLSQGWGLQALVSIIKSFIDIEAIRQRYKGKLVGTVLDGYLSLRKLVVQRTKMIESTQDLLLGLLEQLTTGTEAETRDFMSVCIQTVAKYSPTDLRSPVFIFERLCSIIRPEESAASDFLMILEKDPQQEDFLQGRMSGNPYVSKEPGLGPLMRDVKNKICTDCELVALLEDDSGMELLVNNKIISLDLPVADVYRKIWQPARESEPMRIVYRMRGLLGDATEDMVNTLASNNAEEEDSETVYRMASVLQQCGGLDVMLKRLGYIHNYHRGKQLVSVLLKLFHYCLKLKVNRMELIKPEKDTISVMLRALNRALRAEQQVMSAPPPVQGQGQSITEKVLQIMEIVLSEASKLPPDQYTEFTKRCGDSDQLMLLLDRINSPFVRHNTSVLEALMKLIPFLACGEQEKMKTLLDHFKPYLNFSQFDLKHSDNEVTYLECFCVITSGIKQNANGSRLKQMIIDRKILADAIEYITILAPPVKTLLATDAEDWKEFIGRPSLPYVIRFLTGLCSGHAPSQEIVGAAMIPILHKLEHMSSNGQIGSLSENLMETLCESEKVNQQIKDIRKQTRAEKKRLAMAVREKHLTSIGMKTNKKGQVVVTSAVMKEAEGLKEESGVICSICREGYHNQPNKVLAVYTFTKRVNIEEGELRSRKVQGLFTVSHMNIVHIDCHASAVRLATGRDEWESAALHNANTRCNGLLPLWGPNVSESNFAAALAKHNSYLRNSTELRDDSYTLTVHDIKLLLLRFAHEQPFSSDSGGGGRNSNMLLIPYQLLLALYVINTQRSAKLKEKNLQTFLDAPKTKYVESCYEVEGPYYWLVMSTLLWSKETWNQNKIKMLERLLILAQARKVSPNGCTVLKDFNVQEYSVYKPVLVLFGIVDGLFNIMFKSVQGSGEWCESLTTYIRNNDVSLAESSEKIISTYESELLPCESLSEMIDVIGMLGEIADPNEWLKGILANTKA